MTDNRPISEQWYEAARDHADLEAAASILEESKSAFLSQEMSRCGDMAVSKAEMIVKASSSWKAYIDKMVSARKEANLAKVKMEFLRMKFFEWQSAEANHRIEAKL